MALLRTCTNLFHDPRGISIKHPRMQSWETTKQHIWHKHLPWVPKANIITTHTEQKHDNTSTNEFRNFLVVEQGSPHPCEKGDFTILRPASYQSMSNLSSTTQDFG